ncbi:type II secretion system F family protein [Desulfocicer niacini]
MTTFEYTALNRRGKKEQGLITADSKTAAGTLLRKKNIYLVTINEINAENTPRDTGGKCSDAGGIVFSRISRGEISMMTRQLATLVSAGFNLISALETLILQTRSRALIKIISKMRNAIEEGNSFSLALALYPSLFTPIYINMVKAGESSGTLDIVLERLADLMETQEETRSKIQASLAYPVLMALVGVLVLLFLLTYIVPGLVGIFADMDQTLPGPTQFLITVSGFLKSFWWVLVLIFLIIMMGFYLLKKTEKGAFFIDRTIFMLPKIGSLLKKSAAARFSRILGSLLEHGVPVLTALDIAKSIIGNRVLSAIITKAQVEVQQGGELGLALEQHRAFPVLATQMIKVGEKSGTLEKMLERTAAFYEKEVDTSLTAMTAMLEPLIILVMGVVVGFIVLSVCLPIFEMNQLVR